MTQIVDARIDTVKLYHQGATVYRTVEVNAVDGVLPDEVEIVGLPLSLHDATVRLSVDTPRGALVASQLRVGLYVAPREFLPEEPDQESIAALERELDLLTTRKNQLGIETNLLSFIQVPPRPSGRQGAPPPASPMAARVALEAFVADAVAERAEQEAKLLNEIERVREELEQLRERQRLASTARRATASEVTKTVIAKLVRRGTEPVTSARLTLAYFVPGARWSPQYQCRIDRAGGEAVIQLRALICQSSGEDWRGVKLELSTASPMQWTQLPKLDAIKIGKVQPKLSDSRGFRPPPQGASLLFKDYDEARTRASILVPTPSSYQSPHFPSRDHIAPESLLWQSMLAGSTNAANVISGAPADGALFDEIISEEESYAYEDEDDYMLEEPEPAMEAFGRAASGGAPPPVMARSAVASMPVGMSAPAPPPSYQSAPAPAPAARPSPKRKKSAAPGGGGIARDKSSASIDTGESLGEAISFMLLRLSAPGAGSHQRGKLLPSKREARYLELFERSGLTPDFDVHALLRTADEEGSRALMASLPTGAYNVRHAAGRFDYTYKADDRVDVPSDAAYHSVPLGDRSAKCTLRYVTVPREAPHVYRVASIENPTSAPLLMGPAEIYVGDEFVLTTTLPTVSPKERFKLGLGVEQAIKCARNTTYREERSGRAVVATAELHHGISIQLVNNLSRAIDCEVRERIPQPRPDAEVVIEELDVQPAWTPYEQNEQGDHAVIQGGRKWTLTIEPSEEVKLEANYVIKIYANNEIIGGNRREL